MSGLDITSTEKCDKCGRNVHTIRFLVGFIMKKPVWRNVCKECYEKYAGEGKKID